jgi:hypothetical protein
MYVAVSPNRGSPPAILLRESYRDGAKVRNRTRAEAALARRQLADGTLVLCEVTSSYLEGRCCALTVGRSGWGTGPRPHPDRPTASGGRVGRFRAPPRAAFIPSAGDHQMATTGNGCQRNGGYADGFE